MADELCKTWVLSWDQEGLEGVVLAYDPQWLMDSLANGTMPSIDSTVNTMIMRARFNSQRHYEIYAINFDYDMTEEDIRNYFNESPQSFVDLIRERGHKMYSDRAREERIVIR